MRGRFVDIGGGRSLRAVQAGPWDNGRAPVILEAGAFGFSADWDDVQAELAARGHPSLAYDRAGLGLSPPASEPRDGPAVGRDLDRLLERLGVTGPFVFCGHSMAGLHARLFAARHRQQLLGVVLVDATVPEAVRDRTVLRLIGWFSMGSRVTAKAARLGLLRLLRGTRFGNSVGVRGAADAEKREAFINPTHNHWAAREVAVWPRTAHAAMDVGDYPPELPVAVVLAGWRTPLAAFKAAQRKPADASSRGWFVQLDEANHATMLNSRFAGAIAEAVEHVSMAAGA